MQGKKKALDWSGRIITSAQIDIHASQLLLPSSMALLCQNTASAYIGHTYRCRGRSRVSRIYGNLPRNAPAVIQS
ncbi:hypothetical protein P280DRAFT_137702 [Massarina eburnea CBS 473.64]|uniref:Uncharacterized protein n=1 Tax=Massarina eburnea CBS 473.64 TaxID=1395130 RepID=A0A6A6RPE1_9PLEO|nr:hypothetical protein P280DRAFT_137702 [Massarina eburnea CBS 473.64]